MDLGNGALGPNDLIFRVLLHCRWVSVGVCTCVSVQGEGLFIHATRLEKCPLVSDRDRPPIFQECQTKECEDPLGYVYVDNIGVLSTSRSRAEEVMGKLTTTFDYAGLLTHSVSVSDSLVISLGIVLDCERRRSALGPRRFRKLRRGMDVILKAKTVTGSTLEVVIGHAT